MVSLASFDYLRGLYPNTGIIWIDAQPDVSMVNDGYPNAHAMVGKPNGTWCKAAIRPDEEQEIKIEQDSVCWTPDASRLSGEVSK